MKEYPLYDVPWLVRDPNAYRMSAKHGITPERVYTIVKWFFNQARKRRKYDFLEKFSPSAEHITDF